jgi:hypothetical protein
LAKSQEICVSARHKTHWQFFNEGQLFEDDTFHVGEKCQFNEDFPAFVPTVSVFLQFCQDFCLIQGWTTIFVREPHCAFSGASRARFQSKRLI